MSYIDLTEVKNFLEVIHSDDDSMLQLLLNGAEQEALDFMNRTSFASLCEEDSNYDSDSATMPDNVRIGVYFLVQKSYGAAPGEIEILDKAARRLLMPYRCGMGI